MNIILEKIRKTRPVTIGPRVLKTWLATSLGALLGETPLVGNVFFVLMGTLLGMQNTVNNSFTLGKGRIIGTTIGALIGFLFSHFDLTSPLFVGFAVVLTILVCKQLNILHSFLITVTLCLLIIFTPEQEGGLLYYTVFRIIDTVIGVVLGILINRFVYPPQHLKFLVKEFHALLSVAENAMKDRSLLPDLQNEIIKLEAFHKNYEVDEKYDKNNVSNEKLKKTVDGAHDLCFHIRMETEDAPEEIKQYHEKKVHQTLEELKTMIDELLKELYLK